MRVTVVLHIVKITPMPLADYETTSRETYSEPCEISRMEPFEKNSQWLKIVNNFRKNLHLRCLIGAEYAFDICWVIFYLSNGGF